MRKIFSFLQDEENWTPWHHVDLFLGEYQKQNVERIYVPRTWLVGQAAGESDIAEKSFEFRPFMDAESIVYPTLRLPMVAVLGPICKGTSAVAGLLHHLDISMGNTFGTADITKAGGHFEAQELARMCRRFFDQPWLTEASTFETRVKLLRIWATGHTHACQQSFKLIGGLTNHFYAVSSRFVRRFVGDA